MSVVQVYFCISYVATKDDHCANKVPCQSAADSHNLIQLQRPRCERVLVQLGAWDRRKVSLLQQDRMWTWCWCSSLLGGRLIMRSRTCARNKIWK